jgi:hypothetical protein
MSGRRHGVALALLLTTSPPVAEEANPALVLDARDALRGQLSGTDYRYLEFQLWQEGVARFVEYAAALAASQAGEASRAFRSLPDYGPYRAIADRTGQDLRQELKVLSLKRGRRVSFYPLGAAVALLLEETRPDWKRAYTDRPFALAALLRKR